MSLVFTHPNPEMQLEEKRTALVFADLQNDFLEPFGSYYPLIADKLKELNVYDNIETLLKTAQESGIYVVHSPHYYYPTDLQWVAPPQAIADYLIRVPNGFVFHKGPVSLDGFVGSGADYPERLKKYLMDGKMVNTSPHKGLSCQSNDMVKQLRQRRVEKLIVAGPVGNLCLENHVRDLVEAGFEIVVVRDAIAAGLNDEGDGYLAAMVNYRFITNGICTTEEAVKKMKLLATDEQLPSSSSVLCSQPCRRVQYGTTRQHDRSVWRLYMPSQSTEISNAQRQEIDGC